MLNNDYMTDINLIPNTYKVWLMRKIREAILFSLGFFAVSSPLPILYHTLHSKVNWLRKMLKKFSWNFFCDSIGRKFCEQLLGTDLYASYLLHPLLHVWKVNYYFSAFLQNFFWYRVEFGINAPGATFTNSLS